MVLTHKFFASEVDPFHPVCGSLAPTHLRVFILADKGASLIRIDRPRPHRLIFSARGKRALAMKSEVPRASNSSESWSPRPSAHRSVQTSVC